MEIELFGNKLKVFEDGKVLVLGTHKSKGEYYEKKFSLRGGYKRLQLWNEGKKKCYQIHRIIAYAYLGLDINNPKIQIDHIDRDRLNNCISNLRLVSNQENQFNKCCKGYTKIGNKYRARIRLNGKYIYLGNYDTRELAHNAYLIGKQIYHPLPQ